MTRKENLEKCKKLLYESIVNTPLSKEDSDYLLNQIFPLHKRWEEKRSGKLVKYVIVRNHPLYQNRCFALLLDNGDVVDISFLECINRPRLVKDIEEACKSEILQEDNNDSITGKDFKNLVSKWLKTFDNEELTVGKDLVTIDGKSSFKSEFIRNNFKKYYEENV